MHINNELDRAVRHYKIIMEYAEKNRVPFDYLATLVQHERLMSRLDSISGDIRELMRSVDNLAPI